jgi:PD-(D/E)XK nuclease superfamily
MTSYDERSNRSIPTPRREQVPRMVYVERAVSALTASVQPTTGLPTSFSSTTSIHGAQLLSYLKLSGHPVGLLINFNVRLLKEGLRRLVLGLKE